MHTDLGSSTGGWMFGQLSEVGKALAAFMTDLGSAADRVTLVTLSEFRPPRHENGSGGVDHGYGNFSFVLGGGVNGGKVYGTWPGVAPDQTQAGDLKATTDYRSVLAEVLEKRCGLTASGVLPAPRRSGSASCAPRPERGPGARVAGSGRAGREGPLAQAAPAPGQLQAGVGRLGRDPAPEGARRDDAAGDGGAETEAGEEPVGLAARRRDVRDDLLAAGALGRREDGGEQLLGDPCRRASGVTQSCSMATSGLGARPKGLSVVMT